MNEGVALDAEIRIRAFRAVDDPVTCQKFIDGHRTVLEHHGIQKVTSSNDEWAQNPAVFVIVVESMDGQKLYGGSRVHAANGITPLPIEDATGYMDSKIYDIVAEYAQNGTGELCGLWNSKEVAGLGIGSFIPTRCTVAIAEQLGINTFFGLCAPATVRFNQWLGSKILTTVGNNGTFYYPKLDLIATAVIHEDLPELRDAHKREREKILFLRRNLQCVVNEKSIFKNLHINVHYDLKIKSADIDEFKLGRKNPSYVI